MHFTRKNIKDIQPVVKGHKNAKKAYLAFKFSLLFFVLSSAIYGIYSFFTTYSLRTPIIIQSPIVKRHQEAVLTPVGSPSAKLQGAVVDLAKIADIIYMMESSSGKNDGCTRLGLFNGYGWRQNSFEWKCFSSREEVRGYVIDWLTRNIKNGDIEESLCYYNVGIREHGCKYALTALAN